MHVWVQDPVSKKWMQSGRVIAIGERRSYDVQLGEGRIWTPSSTTSTLAWARWIKGTGNTIADALSRNPVEDRVDELAESDVSYIGDNLSISDFISQVSSLYRK